MNEITVLIYFICFAVVFGATFAFMWRMMTITLKDFDRVMKYDKSSQYINRKLKKTENPRIK